MNYWGPLIMRILTNSQNNYAYTVINNALAFSNKVR